MAECAQGRKAEEIAVDGRTHQQITVPAKRALRINRIQRKLPENEGAVRTPRAANHIAPLSRSPLTAVLNRRARRCRVCVLALT